MHPALVLVAAVFVAACGPEQPTSGRGSALGPRPSAVPPADSASCERGDGVACNRIAAGLGNKGLGFRERACELGVGEACYVLALTYDERGDNVGVVKDPTSATLFYRRGCEAGYGDACGPAGERYRDGRGVVASNEISQQLFARATRGFEVACERGDGDACRSLGMAFALGRGVKRDPAAARRYGDQAWARFNELCEAGDAENCREVGACHHLGGCGDRPMNKPLAITFYDRACESGDAAACTLARIARAP